MTWRKGHFQFAKKVALYAKQLPKNVSNSGYENRLLELRGRLTLIIIEANASLSKKNFIMRIKICRKEVKGSTYSQRLIAETNDEKCNQEGITLRD